MKIKFNKIICVVLSIALILGVGGMFSFAGVNNGWVSESGNWKYYSNGVYKIGWQNNIPGYEGKWFYFNRYGLMQVGLKDDIPGYEGKEFFFNDDGTLLTGWKYFGTHMLDGILFEEWMYFTENGALSGWQNNIPGYEGKWFYFMANRMCMDAARIDGKTYFFNKDGTLHIGWQNVKSYLSVENDLWMYFTENGALDGWQNNIPGYEGKWFYFYGEMMWTGLAYIDEKYYYFNENGTMFIGWKNLKESDNEKDCWVCFTESGVKQL